MLGTDGNKLMWPLNEWYLVVGYWVFEFDYLQPHPQPGVSSWETRQFARFRRLKNASVF